MTQQRPMLNMPNTSTRKVYSSVGQPHATMTTEYQENYVHPKCYTTMAVVTSHKDRYHALKGTGVDHTTLRKIYVSHKLHPKVPPKDRKPKMQPPKVNETCTCLLHHPPSSVPKQRPSMLDGYTSMYKDSYQAWKINKRKPFKLSDSLKVDQGLVVTNGTYQNNSVHGAARDVYKPLPFESITSYRYDYVNHPVQPRIRREKPADQTKGLPLQLTGSSMSKLAQDQEDEDSELNQHFKTMSLENELYGRGSPPEYGDNFISTTHADFTAHNCERTKPYLPSMQTMGKSKKPFQGISTMKDDYRAWDTPRRFPYIRKDHDYPTKSIISHCMPKPAESKTLTSLSPGSKLQETRVCTCISTCDAIRTSLPQNGAFSTLESVSPGIEESRMGCTSPLDRGVTWANDGTCAEASQDPKILNCLASDKS